MKLDFIPDLFLFDFGFKSVTLILGAPWGIQRTSSQNQIPGFNLNLGKMQNQGK